MKIELKTDNAVFEDHDWDFEVSRILHKLAADIAEGRRPEKLMDYNGNKVGKVTY